MLYFFSQERLCSENLVFQGFPKVLVRISFNYFNNFARSIEVPVSFDFKNGFGLKCSLFQFELLKGIFKCIKHRHYFSVNCLQYQIFCINPVFITKQYFASTVSNRGKQPSPMVWSGFASIQPYKLRFLSILLPFSMGCCCVLWFFLPKTLRVACLILNPIKSVHPHETSHHCTHHIM